LPRDLFRLGKSLCLSGSIKSGGGALSLDGFRKKESERDHSEEKAQKGSA
jgi:hypothetical protein